MIQSPSPNRSTARVEQSSEATSFIQPIGCLLAADMETGKISYASRNCPDLLGVELDLILGAKLGDLIGTTIWHGARNAAGLPGFEKRRIELEGICIGGCDLAASVSQSGTLFIIELEPQSTLSTFSFREQDFIFTKLTACDDLDTLFSTTTRLARHLTGFDRVMIERFDRNGMSEVISEAKTGSDEPMMGQRNLYWNRKRDGGIPASLLQPSLVSDVDAAPVAIVAAEQNAPSLDLPHVLLKSPPPDHLAQMKDMGSKASLTLPIIVGSTPWGTLSFHHKTAKTPSTQVRQTLAHALLPFFTVKLEQLRDRESLAVCKKLSGLQMTLHRQMGQKRDLNQAISLIGPEIRDALEVDGFALVADSASYSFGMVPSQNAIDVLAGRAKTSGDKIQQIDLLEDALVSSATSAEATVSALVVAEDAPYFLILFRYVKAGSSAHYRQMEEKESETREALRTRGPAPAWTPCDFERAEHFRPFLMIQS